MGNNGVVIKGNKDGLNILIDMSQFGGFDDMLSILVSKLLKGKRFYRESTVYITTTLSDISEKDADKLKEILLKEIGVKEIIFEDIYGSEIESGDSLKVFKGIYEGKTKFYRKAVRGGQTIRYSGNIVIIGDVNHGSEVYAGGNIIVLGSIKGNVFAGTSGNREAFIAAFLLQPEVLKIGDLMAISPDSEKPMYPEIVKVKDNEIIVEPYLNNKYI